MDKLGFSKRGGLFFGFEMVETVNRFAQRQQQRGGGAGGSGGIQRAQVDAQRVLLLRPGGGFFGAFLQGFDIVVGQAQQRGGFQAA